MKRKVAALTLSALMAVSLLAGCQKGGAAKESSDAKSDKKAEVSEEKKDTKEKGADITLWTYPVGSWGKAEVVDQLLASFNKKYPDIHVTVEYLDYTNGDDQINTAIEGGQAPDLVLEGPERLVTNWGAKGYMVDLSDLFTAENTKDMSDAVKNACKSADGKVYEYPLCSVAHCMAINRNMFEKADALKYLDEETHKWKSTQDFLKAIQAVYDSGQENVMAIYCAGQGGDQGTRALINNMYGGTFTNAQHTEYTANSEENAKALQALADQKGVNFDASLVGGDEINLFRQEQLAVSLCWNAAQQNNADNGKAGETNNGSIILPMEFPSDAKVALCGGIWGFGIFDNGDSAKVEAAKDFIDFMANENAKESVKASGFFPAHNDITGIYEGTDTAKTMDMFQKHFMPDMGDYYQVVPGWATARTEWWNMLQRIGTGSDVKTELKTFVDNANAAAKAEK